MFARAAIASILLSATAAAQLTIPLGKAPRQIERPRAPIEEFGPQWAATCKDWDEWDKPAPPVRIHGNTYLVGTCGISAILVAGGDSSRLTATLDALTMQTRMPDRLVVVQLGSDPGLAAIIAAIEPTVHARVHARVGPTTHDKRPCGSTSASTSTCSRSGAPDTRTAVVSRVELGLSYAEIASALEIPTANAARMFVARALVRLAREMGQQSSA